jgi:tetratricopeptide (TPR) repeat protein
MTADPTAANAHLDRGNVLMAQERFDEAIGEYREADELWQTDRSQQRKRALYG